MSNDGAADIAIGVAAGVAETFTRRLVDLERDRDYWMQEFAKRNEARNEALDRAQKAEAEVEHWRDARNAAIDAGVLMKADLTAAQARIAELEEEVKVLRGPDQPASETCPHAEGTPDWAQWHLELGRVLVCDEQSGFPVFYRIDNGVLQVCGPSGGWATSDCHSAHKVPWSGWRVLSDAEVAALTGEAQ